MRSYLFNITRKFVFVNLVLGDDHRLKPNSFLNSKGFQVTRIISLFENPLYLFTAKLNLNRLMRSEESPFSFNYLNGFTRDLLSFLRTDRLLKAYRHFHKNYLKNISDVFAETMSKASYDLMLYENYKAVVTGLPLFEEQPDTGSQARVKSGVLVPFCIYRKFDSMKKTYNMCRQGRTASAIRGGTLSIGTLIYLMKYRNTDIYD